MCRDHDDSGIETEIGRTRVRDAMACEAMGSLLRVVGQKMLVEIDKGGTSPEKCFAVIAKLAYGVADAMMAERGGK